MVSRVYFARARSRSRAVSHVLSQRVCVGVVQDFCPGVTLKHPDAATYLQDATYGPHLLKQFGTS